MQTNTNFSAILRGEQRSNRFRYHHSVAAAAREVGIPPSWIWFWLLAKLLKFRRGLRKVWVRLEDVQKLFADTFAVCDAFYATGEHLTSPQAIQAVVDRWPDDGINPYIEFRLPAKLLRKPARPEVLVPNPVFGEEKKSEEAV